MYINWRKSDIKYNRCKGEVAMEENENKKPNKIIAPLFIIQREWIYITWLIVVVIFGQFNIILDVFN